MRPLSQTQAFRDALADCSLQDLHSSGEFFTWVNRRKEGDLIFERLDRFVGSFAWRMLYPTARAQTLEFYHSDHRPVLLEFGSADLDSYYHAPIFRFELHWASESDCAEMVAKGWSSQIAYLNLSDCIFRCKQILGAWVGDRFRHLPRKIKQKRTELNHLKTHERWIQSEHRIQILEKEIEALSSKEKLY
ncbi:uncharacterized protein [Henckelia pumila]|uniref:uncharacterized protein n=1 Tax=Henckelia pumila TaxID=405737 RepID=UPI003C6DD07E